ncbi:MAG: nucleotide-binding protein [Planctomycetaceae bacterium]|nr:nucleotide-binding protein [Planctomycetaceae bacterium]
MYIKKIENIFEPIDSSALELSHNAVHKLRNATQDVHSFGISFDFRFLHHVEDFRKAIERGVNIHVTVLAPSVDLTIVAPIFGQSVEELRREMLSTDSVIKKFQERWKKQFHVHYLDKPPQYRLFAMDIYRNDHAQPNAVIIFYGTKTDIHELPAFEFNTVPSNPVTNYISDYKKFIEAPPPKPKLKLKPKVFLVHGHDNNLLHKVRLFLTEHKVDYVVLNMENNNGDTIIEKLEKNSNVHYAIVLLTPDDYGCAIKDFSIDSVPDCLQLRARENIIFEWGYLTAKIGRKNICCIKVGKTTNIPSDTSGIAYFEMKSHDDDIPNAVLKELKKAGFSIKFP